MKEISFSNIFNPLLLPYVVRSAYRIFVNSFVIMFTPFCNRKAVREVILL